MISFSYLTLTHMSEMPCAPSPSRLRAVVPVLSLDWRDGRPGILDQTIVPLLEQWSKTGKREPARPSGRRERLRHCFAVGGSPWDEEKVLDRYELLYEAGLVEETRRDGRETHVPRGKRRRLASHALRPSPSWQPPSQGSAPS